MVQFSFLKSYPKGELDTMAIEQRPLVFPEPVSGVADGEVIISNTGSMGIQTAGRRTKPGGSMIDSRLHDSQAHRLEARPPCAPERGVSRLEAVTLSYESSVVVDKYRRFVTSAGFTGW